MADVQVTEALLEIVTQPLFVVVAFVAFVFMVGAYLGGKRR